MKLTKALRQELVEKIMDKTEKQADIAALKKRIAEQAFASVVAQRDALYPEFVAALKKTPKVIIEQLNTQRRVRVRCDHIVLHYFSESAYSYYADISPVPMPFYQSYDVTLDDALAADIKEVIQKYQKAESDLLDLLNQCSTSKQLESFFPEAAAILPVELKGLPAIVPEKALASLAAVGFPPK